jgi:hypothetical protein
MMKTHESYSEFRSVGTTDPDLEMGACAHVPMTTMAAAVLPSP